MDVEKNNSYNEYYYTHCCGRPYERDEHWMTFFGGIAERIVSDICPTTILDAGCAMGFLVEALRQKNVETWGIDISEYAIKKAHQSIQPYCWIGSVTEVFPRKYDLIVSIEVLEHLPKAEAEKALANLCQHTDDILFSSSPFDYKEATHFNVQPPEYWAEQFAKHGFIRDVDFDASFITPWAVRFRRNQEPLHRVIRSYERRFWLLWKENRDLRESVVEAHNKLGDLEKSVVDLNAQNVNLQSQLKESNYLLEQTQIQLQNYQSQLQEAQEQQDNLQVKIVQNQAELERSQLQLQQTQDEFKQSQLRLQETKAQLEQSELQLQQTQNELERSQSQLPATHTELEQSQLQLQQTQAEVKLLQNHIKAMESSKFWKLRSRWFGVRDILGLTEKDQTFQQNLLIRIRYFWNIYRVKGFPYVANKVLQKSIQIVKYQDVPSHALPNIPQSDDINYQKWLNNNYPTPEILKQKAIQVEELTYQPLFSLIMPVFNTPTKFLKEAIESVLNQVYPYWELCIADDASSDNQVRKLLDEYSAKDSRIKVIFRAENGHISRCSNSALEIATGEFVALLDHDDLLTPDALYEIASLLNEHPEADMIYSDEDKINENGKLQDPFFKPDWCPDSFLSRMYTCHLGIYRRELLKTIGGFRTGYEGSQDYDLVLRFTEKTTRIFHIPKILYHWRIHPQSAASKPDQKPYAVIAAEKALADALVRRGEDGRVTQAESLVGHYIMRYTIKDYKLVSIIIPTRDLGKILDKCLTSIFEKTVYPNYEIILIDNGSQEQETADIFAKWQQKEPDRFKCYQFDIPFNYSKINNYGVEKSQGDYLLFLNNDTEVLTSDWIDAMVEQAQRPSIGAVGALLLYPDNTIQHAGVVMGIGGVANHSHKHFPVNSPGYFGQILTVNNYSSVTAACLMCRREVFEVVGGFEEQLSVAFNDVDFCLKIVEKGYRNIYLPHVVLYHYESKSRGYEDTPEKLARFIQETEYMQNNWKKFIEYDPCYSINLTSKDEDYSIKI
ncbi:MAG: glycosyltransferase [Nostocales cyanobacterium 94392]|nr:glycosyltransferase [Nostocales cyanobacterium 94392]